MHKENKKPKWGRPKLVVVARDGRQERVLEGCKAAGIGGGGGGAWGDCVTSSPYCDLCVSSGTS